MNKYSRSSAMAVLVTCAVACGADQRATPIVPWLDANVSGASTLDAAATTTGGTEGAVGGGATAGANPGGGGSTSGGGSSGATTGGVGGGTTGGVGGTGAVGGGAGDAGMDAGAIGAGDAATDATSVDAAVADAASPDAAIADAASVDAAVADAASMDAAVADAASMDAAATDAGTWDAASDAATDAANDGAAADAAADAGSFQACVQALKPKCSYADHENACSSIMTAPIPLADGGVWPSTELPQGPYGTYVEWNEGSAFANPDSILEPTCTLVAATFGEPTVVTNDVLNLRGQQLTLYTIFRPACMKPGEKYPVITWGNGTCNQSGSYGPLLATLASHGFVVIAANSRFTSQGNNEMLRALDLAAALNGDTQSIFYQQLDLTKVGAMGHSQGAAATSEAAKDARVKAAMLWNGGSSSAVKPFLVVSGERDLGDPTVAVLSSQVEAAAQPGAWLFYHKVLQTGGNFTGHFTLMMQPERVVGPAVAWWKYMLNGDAEAKKMFVGADCGLCNKKDDYEYGQHNLQ